MTQDSKRQSDTANTARTDGRNLRGCDGKATSKYLFLRITSFDLNTGLANVGGGVYLRPTKSPFTWNWGDGSITQGWFPQSHSYSNTEHDYMLQVTSHEDDGATDCVRILIPIYKRRLSENLSSGNLPMREIDVLATQPWTDTGVDVNAGDLISITATGSIQFSFGGQFMGPDGDGVDCHHLGVAIYRWTFPDADLSCHSLLARVGPTGPIFEVGSSWRFRAATPGRLYLGVNDNFFPDNSGSWEATISLQASYGPLSNSPPTPVTKPASFRVGSQPTGIVYDGAHLWVSNNSGNSVTELEPEAGKAIGTFPTGPYPTGIAFDGANIWVANYGYNGSNNTLTVLNANTGQELPFSPVAVGNGPRMVVFDGANIWVTDETGNSVTKVQANDGSVLGTYRVGVSPDGIAFDGHNIWVNNGGSNSVTKLRASDGKILGTYPMAGPGYGIAFDGAHLWVANGGSGNITELALDGTSLRTVPVGRGPHMIAYDRGNIWVANYDSNNVTKISATDGKVLGTFPVRGNPWGVASDGMHAWVSNFAGSNVWKF